MKEKRDHADRARTGVSATRRPFICLQPSRKGPAPLDQRSQRLPPSDLHPGRRTGRRLPAVRLPARRPVGPPRMGQQLQPGRVHRGRRAARGARRLPAEHREREAAPRLHTEPRVLVPRPRRVRVVRDQGERHRRREGLAHPPGHSHLPGLPQRGLRPAGPAPSLPVHELHELRAPLQHHSRPALRPAQHDDERLPDVPVVRGGVPRPGEQEVPRTAERLPRVRPAAGPVGRRRPAARIPPRGPARRRRGHPPAQGRSRQRHRRVPPGRRRPEPGRSPEAAGAEAQGGEAARPDVPVAGRGRERMPRLGPRGQASPVAGITHRAPGAKGTASLRRLRDRAFGRPRQPVPGGDAPQHAAPPRADGRARVSGRRNQRQPVGRTHLHGRKGGRPAAGRDRRPLPRPQPPDSPARRRLGGQGEHGARDGVAPRPRIRPPAGAGADTGADNGRSASGAGGRSAPEEHRRHIQGPGCLHQPAHRRPRNRAGFRRVQAGDRRPAGDLRARNRRDRLRCPSRLSLHQVCGAFRPPGPEGPAPPRPCSLMHGGERGRGRRPRGVVGRDRLRTRRDRLGRRVPEDDARFLLAGGPLPHIQTPRRGRSGQRASPHRTGRALRTHGGRPARSRRTQARRRLLAGRTPHHPGNAEAGSKLAVDLQCGQALRRRSSSCRHQAGERLRRPGRYDAGVRTPGH